MEEEHEVFAATIAIEPSEDEAVVSDGSNTRTTWKGTDPDDRD